MGEWGGSEESSKPWLFSSYGIVLAVQRFIISVNTHFHPRNLRGSIFEKLSCKFSLQRPFYFYFYFYFFLGGRMYMCICVTIFIDLKNRDSFDPKLTASRRTPKVGVGGI